MSTEDIMSNEELSLLETAGHHGHSTREEIIEMRRDGGLKCYLENKGIFNQDNAILKVARCTKWGQFAVKFGTGLFTKETLEIFEYLWNSNYRELKAWVDEQRHVQVRTFYYDVNSLLLIVTSALIHRSNYISLLQPKDDWDEVVHLSRRECSLGTWLDTQRSMQSRGLLRSDRKTSLNLLGIWYFVDEG